MTGKCWAVYLADPALESDRQSAGPYDSLEEAREEARRLNAGRRQGEPLYFAGTTSGDGPMPAGQCDYPEDGGDCPVPWNWRGERPRRPPG